MAIVQPNYAKMRMNLLEIGELLGIRIIVDNGFYQSPTFWQRVKRWLA